MQNFYARLKFYGYIIFLMLLCILGVMAEGILDNEIHYMEKAKMIMHFKLPIAIIIIVINEVK